MAASAESRLWAEFCRSPDVYSGKDIANEVYHGKEWGREEREGEGSEGVAHSAIDLLAWATALLEAMVCFTGMSRAEP